MERRRESGGLVPSAFRLRSLNSGKLAEDLTHLLAQGVPDHGPSESLQSRSLGPIQEAPRSSSTLTAAASPALIPPS